MYSERILLSLAWFRMYCTRWFLTHLLRLQNDVSNNRRQTRSLVAKARTGPSNHVDSSNPDGVRRSPRLSKKRDNNSSIGQGTDGEVDTATAGTRLRKAVAKKGSSATKTTRSSRSRSKSKPQEPLTQPGPEEAIEKKSRGRSRNSRKVSDSGAVEPKQSRTAKRSRTQDIQVDAVSEQPERKVARGRGTRSRSRPNNTIAKAKAAPKLLADEFMQEVNHNLVSLPFDPCRYTEGLSVYDTPNRNDANEAPEYVTDIFQRLFYAEVSPVAHLCAIPRFAITLFLTLIVIRVPLSATEPYSPTPIHAQTNNFVYYNASHSR
jgi:hypothetical protein